MTPSTRPPHLAVPDSEVSCSVTLLGQDRLRSITRIYGAFLGAGTITYQPGEAEPYRAIRRHDSTALQALTPAELRAIIRADYYGRPR
jgi:hypothetical protein